MKDKAISERIRERIQTSNTRFWAGDNISAHILDTEKDELIDELTIKFEGVLDSLIIDRENDPNSRGTAKRLAKMYVSEIMSGRYDPAPDATAFPNDSKDRYEGLSKYTRIAQWCARRGTLQEELCNDIAREIMKATGSENVAVYIQAIHGCCENRGIMAHSSLTQTTVLKGAFNTDPGTKKEFMDNVKLQQEFAPR